MANTCNTCAFSSGTGSCLSLTGCSATTMDGWKPKSDSCGNGYSLAANDAAKTILDCWSDWEAEAADESQAAEDARAGYDILQSQIACVVDGAIDDSKAENARLREVLAKLLNTWKWCANGARDMHKIDDILQECAALAEGDTHA